MELNIEIFYGLSGTLKSTTIASRISDIKTNHFYLPSKIKTWKELEGGIFSGKVEANDLNFAINHLCMLEDSVNYCWGYGIDNLFVERGVTDMLFYKSQKTELEEGFIKDVVSYEDGLTINNADIEGVKVRKVLLVMKDKDFIIKSINSHPSRQLFKDAEDYLIKQNEYIGFTEKYNSINEVVEIDSAKDYLAGLGIIYKSSN